MRSKKNYARWARFRPLSSDRNMSVSPFRYLGERYSEGITEVRHADIPAEEVPADAIRLDIHRDDPDAKKRILGWIDHGTVFYWTDADATISERTVQADSIVFINRSGGILPTGMHRTHALGILVAINGIAVAAVATFMLKRRKRKEN